MHTSALQHAHDNGIVHRDIKPENLIVTNDRKHCYLVDFGLALSKADLGRLTPSGYVVGTHGYMSPEQQNGDEPHPGDDVYVLALCLYELLSGHSIPARRDYEDLSTRNESIPKLIDQLILTCTEPNKSLRLRSAAEFGKRLTAAFQLLAPLSDILAQGQLYQVIGAIREMSPSDFMSLPVGQRKLILRRGADVIASTDSKLIPAKGELFPILTKLAIHVESKDYQAIIEPAIEYGFAKVSSHDWIGDRRTRDAIIEAAGAAAKDNHHVIASTLLNWLRARKLTEEDNWLLDAARRLIHPLMANNYCNDEDATALDKLLTEVKGIQRERQASGPLEQGWEHG